MSLLVIDDINKALFKSYDIDVKLARRVNKLYDKTEDRERLALEWKEYWSHKYQLPGSRRLLTSSDLGSMSRSNGYTLEEGTKHVEGVIANHLAAIKHFEESVELRS